MGLLLNVTVMRKLLKAIASGLYIEVTKQYFHSENETDKFSCQFQFFEREDTTDDLKQEFIKILEKDILNKAQRAPSTTTLIYLFDGGFEDTVNEHMKEVLLKLPPLPTNQSYAFPPQTYFSFIVKSYSKSLNLLYPGKSCEWIKEKLR